MASGFEKPITIIEAIDKIDSGDYLLPDIQREYVWKAEQIERLFDSILRDYPINSFMFWAIEEDSIKNNFRFYKFLSKYVEFHETVPQYINTTGYKNFYAVIDGQQRLTSLYLGLKGSYAYKLKYKQRGKETIKKNFPERHLYIDILNEMDPQMNDRQMKYDIRFLTKEQHEALSLDATTFWLKLNDILKYRTQTDLLRFVRSQPWQNSDHAIDTVCKIWDKIFLDPVINYYLEESQELDQVLDIFIRTNSGGQPLSLSDLLMSLISSEWHGAKQEVSDLIKGIYSGYGFKIDKDFVLKTFLVLYNDNIKFSVNNFDKANLRLLEENWDKFQDSILAAFSLLKKWGFSEGSLRSKNAVIPIVYFIYYNDLEENITNPIKNEDAKRNIRKWLCISLLKGVFGSQSDTVLSGIRSVLDQYKGKHIFPFEEIKERFKNSPTKNLSLNDDFLENLLTTQKDSYESYPILALIYSHLNYDDDQVYDQDHLHPASYFKKLKKSAETNEFFTDRNNWNSILNLQLINKSINRSKQAMSLAEWVETKNIDLDNQLIPKNVSLAIEDFKQFIEARRQLLLERLKNIIGMS